MALKVEGFMPTGPGPDVVAAMKALQSALGDNDLAKQVFADANASDRQTTRNHFFRYTQAAAPTIRSQLYSEWCELAITCSIMMATRVRHREKPENYYYSR
jgi:hypothetical protein